MVMSSLLQALCFVAVYISLIMLGGYVFKSTECPDEISAKRKVAEDKREFREYMTKIYSHLEKCSRVLEHGEPELALMIIIKTKIGTMTTEKEDFECKTWSMYNSMFFSFSTITTIGYGKVTPQTRLGQIACSLYTIFGVPINCILLTFIGAYFKKKGS